MGYSRWLIAGLGAVGVALFGPYVWKFYVAPIDNLVTVAHLCETEANKVFALEMTKWVQANNTDAFNPYRKQRDKMIETCVKADGWCAFGDGSIWPSSGPWGFAPRDPIARYAFDVRYGTVGKLQCRE